MANTEHAVAMTTKKEYIISACTVADGDALAANNLPAFWADPEYGLAWPGRTFDYHLIQLSKRIPNNLLANPKVKRHLKAVDPDTGRVVGYARWPLPDGYDVTTWPEAITPAVSDDDAAFFRRLSSMADWDTGESSSSGGEISPSRKIEQEILSRKKYLQLEYLAVHPDQQGKGIATKLVQKGLTEARKMGIDVYVMAFLPGVPLYQRSGFRKENELVVDTGKGKEYHAFMTWTADPEVARS